MKTKLLFSCAAALLLAGCLSTPVRQTNWRPQDEGADFSADGRLAVQYEGKGSYANFDWNRQNGVQTINLPRFAGRVGHQCQRRKVYRAGRSPAESEVARLRTAAGIPRRMDAGAVGGGLAAQLDGGRRFAAGRMEYQPPNTGRRQRQSVGFAQ